MPTAAASATDATAGVSVALTLTLDVKISDDKFKDFDANVVEFLFKFDVKIGQYKCFRNFSSLLENLNLGEILYSQVKYSSNNEGQKYVTLVLRETETTSPIYVFTKLRN